MTDILSLDSAPEEKRTIVLYPKDEIDESKYISVDYSYASISDLVKAAFETDTETKSLPLRIDYTSLCYIIEWFNYKKGKEGDIVPRPLKKTMKDSCVDKWDADFIDRVAENTSHLLNLFESADYMTMNTLLHLCGARIALELKGKTKEQIKNFLERK